MPRKAIPKVSSFGPELLAALLQGTEKELKVELPSFHAAFILRTRLYELRRAMRHENHPLLDKAMRASIAQPSQEKDGKSFLTIRPKDEEFSSALRAAGVTLDSVDSFIPESHDSAPLSPDYIANLLKEV